jgi:hypothetical protein
MVDTVVRLFSAGQYLVRAKDDALTYSPAAEVLERQPSDVPSSSYLETTSPPRDGFSSSEISWFATNCYNLAIKVAGTWPSSKTIHLFQVVTRVGRKTPVHHMYLTFSRS